MAVGLVPIVVDYAGPGELVEEAWGYKLPIGNREDIARNLQGLLGRLIADPGVLREKAVAGMLRVASEHAWDAKAAKIVKQYEALARKA
jgi:glycogen synthase